MNNKFSIDQRVDPRKDVKTPKLLEHYLALDDFEAASRRRLPKQIHSYYAGGVERDQSLRGNLDAFAELSFLPRVLADVSKRSQSTTLLGKRYDAPFGIAPMGLSGLATFDGDLVLARSAREENIPSVVSATSLVPLERLAAEGDARWFQAYLPGEDDRIEALVDRVAAAGYDTFVLTADVPVAGNRENNVRTGFSMPLRPSLGLAWDGLSHPRWLATTWIRTFLRNGIPHFENMDAFRGPPILSASVIRAIGKRDQLSWRHLELIRGRWNGKLVVKGILSPIDAGFAREAGADGVIVSNHGGRQLDGAVAPLRVLPFIVREARGMTVMIDGGIRRGTDVLKAFAMGAHFAFVGRPFLFAAAVAGEAGVRHAIALMKAEIDRDMALLGVSDLSGLDASAVWYEKRP